MKVLIHIVVLQVIQAIYIINILKLHIFQIIYKMHNQLYHQQFFQVLYNMDLLLILLNTNKVNTFDINMQN